MFFIHAQISDALAGSIKEYLYAGAVLINPEWIDYSECKEIGIGYLEYKAWEEIPNLLEKALRLNKDMLLSNREKLYNYFSWNALNLNGI